MNDFKSTSPLLPVDTVTQESLAKAVCLEVICLFLKSIKFPGFSNITVDKSVNR